MMMWTSPRVDTDMGMGLALQRMLLWASPQTDADMGLAPKLMLWASTLKLTLMWGLAPKLIWASPLN